MLRYFVDAGGRFLGTFVDHAPPPTGAIEVPGPPGNGADLWDGSAWLPAADPTRFREAGTARRARQFSKSLERDPLAALVQQARETRR